MDEYEDTLLPTHILLQVSQTLSQEAKPCPLAQCGEVTTAYQGGVDHLPKFFFMNELKEVVMADDRVKVDKCQKHRGVVCSTEVCDQPSLKYCNL